METALDKVKLVIRILIGGLFIFTAVLKLISIDYFTVYIYSFNIFSYALSALVARAVIAAEFVLGCMLIAKIFYKQAWWLTLAMLVGFTFLLIYTAIFRNDTNCHCFGELIELDPVSSILKNIVTIGLMLFVRKEEDYGFRWWKIVFGVILACGLFVPFCAFPPDSIYSIFHKEESSLNKNLFEKSLQDSSLMTTLQDVRRLPENDSVVFSKNTMPLTLSDDKYIIAMLSSGCPHCKLSMKKANTIFKNNDIDYKHLKILIWGNENSISRFLKETESDKFETHIIHPILAIDLVNGEFPTFIFVDHGQVTGVYNARKLTDNIIGDFFTEKN
ncbi:MAG: DoxX family protein [Bacteroidales bacterium]|nr:DoxX family protein [Bacteroidales bacterium]